MRTWRLVIGGALSLAVAAVLVALSFGAPRTFAGIEVPCDATATPTQQPVGQINAFQQIPTCTPVRKVKTATPTFTVTVEPSSTPVPPTEAPPTVAPPSATATSPAGGSAGQAVTPPNTGSGPDSGAGYNLYMLLAAGLVAAIGAGSLAAAARGSRRG